MHSKERSRTNSGNVARKINEKDIISKENTKRINHLITMEKKICDGKSMKHAQNTLKKQ